MSSRHPEDSLGQSSRRPRGSFLAGEPRSRVPSGPHRRQKQEARSIRSRRHESLVSTAPSTSSLCHDSACGQPPRQHLQFLASASLGDAADATEMSSSSGSTCKSGAAEVPLPSGSGGRLTKMEYPFKTASPHLKKHQGEQRAVQAN